MLPVYSVQKIEVFGWSVFQSIEKLIVCYNDAYRSYFLEWNTAKVGVMDQSSVYLSQVLL